jgi:hypothetical protein
MVPAISVDRWARIGKGNIPRVRARKIGILTDFSIGIAPAFSEL